MGSAVAIHMISSVKQHVGVTSSIHLLIKCQYWYTTYLFVVVGRWSTMAFAFVMCEALPATSTLGRSGAYSHSVMSFTAFYNKVVPAPVSIP